MGSILKLNLPLSATICDTCSANNKIQRISDGNLNLICNVPISASNDEIPNSGFAVKIDVRRIRWKREGNGAYSATAQLYVICPKCDKQHIVERSFEAPRIYLEQSRVCEICGGKLTFQEKEMEIEDRGGRPFITVVGKLICRRCQRELPFSAGDMVSDEYKDKNEEAFVVACGKGQKLFIKLKGEAQ